jgi:soluble lytic murein transglycosylase
VKLLKIKVLAVIVLVVFAFCSLFIFSGFKYKKLAAVYAKQYGISATLVISVMKTESNFNKNAVSSKGAVGLMQILPSTSKFIAKKLGYGAEFNLFEPKTNIEFGVYYLKYLLDKFKSEDIAICAYNAGEGNAIKWGLSSGFSLDKIKYKETLNYYKKVKFFKKLYGIINYD